MRKIAKLVTILRDINSRQLLNLAKMLKNDVKIMPFLHFSQIYMLCRRVQIFHFYSRKLSDRVEQHLSYLWIFLWPLGTSWSLRNCSYMKKYRKKV